MGEMLSVKNMDVYYGSIHAIKNVSFHVNEGEIVTLIGANGAGKTTTMHAISGLLRPKNGEIIYCGQPIQKMEAPKIIRLGLSLLLVGKLGLRGMWIAMAIELCVRGTLMLWRQKTSKFYETQSRLHGG